MKPKGIITPRVTREERESDKIEAEQARARAEYDAGVASQREEQARVDAELRAFENEKNILGFGRVANEDLTTEQLSEIDFYLSIGDEERAVIEASSYNYGGVNPQDYSAIKAAANRLRSGTSHSAADAWNDQLEARSLARQQFSRDISESQERVAEGRRSRIERLVEQRARDLGVSSEQVGSVDGQEIVRDESGRVVSLREPTTEAVMRDDWDKRLNDTTDTAVKLGSALAEQEGRVQTELTPRQARAEYTAGLVAKAGSPAMAQELSERYGAGTPFIMREQVTRAERERELAETGEKYYLSREEYLAATTEPPSGFPVGAQLLVDGKTMPYQDWATGIIGETPAGFKPEITATDAGLTAKYTFQKFELETPLLSIDESGIQRATTFGAFAGEMGRKGKELGLVPEIKTDGMDIAVSFTPVGGEPSKAWADLSPRARNLVTRIQRAQQQEGYSELIGLPQDKFGGHATKAGQIYGELKTGALKEEVASYLGITAPTAYTATIELPIQLGSGLRYAVPAYRVATGAERLNATRDWLLSKVAPSYQPLTRFQPLKEVEQRLAIAGVVQEGIIPVGRAVSFTAGTPEEVQAQAIQYQKQYYGDIALAERIKAVEALQTEQPAIYKYRVGMQPLFGEDKYDIVTGDVRGTDWGGLPEHTVSALVGAPESFIGGAQDILMVGQELSMGTYTPQLFYQKMQKGKLIAQKFPLKYGSAAFNLAILPVSYLYGGVMGAKATIEGVKATTKGAGFFGNVAKNIGIGALIGGGIRGGVYAIPRMLSAQPIEYGVAYEETLGGAIEGGVWGYATAKAAEAGFKRGAVKPLIAQTKREVFREPIRTRGDQVTIEKGMRTFDKARASRIKLLDYTDEAALDKWFIRQTQPQTHAYTTSSFDDDLEGVGNIFEAISTHTKGEGIVSSSRILARYDSLTDDVFYTARKPTGGYASRRIPFQQTGGMQTEGYYFDPFAKKKVPFFTRSSISAEGVNWLDDIDEVRLGHATFKLKPSHWERVGTEVKITPISIKSKPIMGWVEGKPITGVSVTKYKSIRAQPYRFHETLTSMGIDDYAKVYADIPSFKEAIRSGQTIYTPSTRFALLSKRELAESPYSGRFYSSLFDQSAPFHEYTADTISLVTTRGGEVAVTPSISEARTTGLIIQNPYEPTSIWARPTTTLPRDSYLDDLFKSFESSVGFESGLDDVITPHVTMGVDNDLSRRLWAESFEKTFAKTRVLPPAPKPSGGVIQIHKGAGITQIKPIVIQQLSVPSVKTTGKELVETAVSASITKSVPAQLAIMPLTPAISTFKIASIVIPTQIKQQRTRTRTQAQPLQAMNLTSLLSETQTQTQRQPLQAMNLVNLMSQTQTQQAKTQTQTQPLQAMNLTSLLSETQTQIQPTQVQTQIQQAQVQTQVASATAQAQGTIPPIPTPLPPFWFDLPSASEKRKRKPEKEKKKRRRGLFVEPIIAPFADILSKTQTEARLLRPAASPSVRVSKKAWLKTKGMRVPTAYETRKKKKKRNRKPKKSKPLWKFKGIRGKKHGYKQ